MSFPVITVSESVIVIEIEIVASQSFPRLIFWASNFSVEFTKIVRMLEWSG